MSRQEYYEYSNIYEYEEEFPYKGAVDDEIEEAEILSGEVTWNAEITWNESLEQYEVFRAWTDHGRNFSHIGESPKEDEFLDDLYSFLQSQGISSEEVEVTY